MISINCACNSFIAHNGYSTCIIIPSFYPFFFENLINLIFDNFLRKILTNKITLKKIQHEEAAIGITWNNFGFDRGSFGYLNKLKSATQAVSTIVGKCFLGFNQPIRSKVLKRSKQLTNQKLPTIVDKLFLSPKLT